jgi:hypothetical protein
VFTAIAFLPAVLQIAAPAAGAAVLAHAPVGWLFTGAGAALAALAVATFAGGHRLGGAPRSTEPSRLAEPAAPARVAASIDTSEGR